MNLHPQQAVDQFLGEHGPTLAVCSGFLDEAVQKIFAKYEEEFPKGVDLPGDTLCSGVRALFWQMIEKPLIAEPSLKIVRRGSSRQLITSSGVGLRVRRHPWNFRTLRRVSVTPPQIDTLFGPDLTVIGYELAILWSPNLKSKALGSACLAAVDGLDTLSPPVIYGLSPLPQMDILSLKGRSRWSEIIATDERPDDFDDFWPEEGFGTDDPA